MNRIDEESPSSGMGLTSLNEASRRFVPGIEFRGIRGEGYDSSPSPSGRNMGFLEENRNLPTGKATPHHLISDGGVRVRLGATRLLFVQGRRSDRAVLLPPRLAVPIFNIALQGLEISFVKSTLDLSFLEQGGVECCRSIHRANVKNPEIGGEEVFKRSVLRFVGI
jgi:hypothetical protein